MDYAFSGHKFTELVSDIGKREEFIRQEKSRVSSSQENIKKRMRPYEMLDPTNNALASLKREFDSVNVVSEPIIKGYEKAIDDLKTYLNEHPMKIELRFRYAGDIIEIRSSDFNHLEKPAEGLGQLIWTLHEFSANSYGEYVESNSLYKEMSNLPMSLDRFAGYTGLALNAVRWDPQRRLVPDFSKLEPVLRGARDEPIHDIHMNRIIEIFAQLKQKTNLSISVSELK